MFGNQLFRFFRVHEHERAVQSFQPEIAHRLDAKERSAPAAFRVLDLGRVSIRPADDLIKLFAGQAKRLPVAAQYGRYVRGARHNNWWPHWVSPSNPSALSRKAVQP